MAIHGYPGGIISATAPTTSPTSASGVWTLDDQLQAGANWPVAPSFLQRSLRFRSSASAYLNRTPATTTNQKTWTFSTWVKRGALTSYQDIFSGGDSSSNCRILFNAGAGSQNDNIFVFFRTGGTFRGSISNAVFRDPSAWYHLVVAIDTTQATDTNRVKIYINGVQQTTNNSYGSGYVPQNTDTGVNTTTEHRIGDSAVYTPSFLDGYLADVNFIDGQALTPNYFGAVDPATGVWEPATYRGSYGTNGFYLPFVPASASFSGSFNGTNQFLSVAQNAAFSFGTGDFTVEAFVNANSWNSVNPIIALGDGAVGGGSPVYSGWVMRYDSSGALGLYRFDGTETYLTGSVTLSTGQWNHLAISRASGTLRMFANGVQVYSAANSVAYNNVNSNTLKIGGNWVTGGGVVNWVNGAISNVRIVKGTGLYTASFTPPTAALTAVSGTSLLTLQNSSIVDNSPNAFSITNNNSVTTSAANPFTSSVGLDASGNGNNWTANNISLSSGTTYDSMTDVPTLTSATQANFCTLNAVAAGDYFASGQTSLTLGSANLNYGTGGRNAFGTIAVSSGKYYWEMSNTANTASAVPLFGLVTIAARTSVYGVYYQPNGNRGLGTLNSGASEAAYGATWTDNDIIGVALDMDAATPTVTYYKNNVSQGAISVSSFVGQSVMAWIQNGANSGNMSGWVNFGQRPFAYTPPTGFVALNTFNLPTPTIGATASTQANDYFDVSLWTGNGTSQSIVNSGSMQPDFVWVKQRSSTQWHRLVDAVRGTNKILYSNDTSAEFTDSTQITAFNSNGFSVGSEAGVNANSATYVGWQWKANGTGVTNTAGSITSTVSANTSSGFSIVTYTGTGANATVGHGLGVAPRMIICKNRASVTDWAVYHASIGNTGALRLNSTAVTETDSRYWNNTTPTSTVISLGSSSTVNGSGNTQVAYCFAEVAGYSRFGSYTGNLSTDGTFVYTGFRPAFIMVKRTDSTGFWTMLDNKRLGYNVTQSPLYANATNAESTAQATDFTSNGFKLRTTDSDVNASGTYIYMAFAESPFKYANAR